MSTGEASLYARWQQGGHRLAGRWQVAFPGWRNGQEGPDFVNALIERDGRILKGDIELHHHAKNWVHHGHHRDPRYNHVLLHVVEKKELAREAMTKEGRKIPTALLSSKVGSPWRGVPSVRNLPGMAERGGWIRFRKKIRRMRRWLHREGEDQGLYLGLCDALGYAKFRGPMRALAKLAPWREIRRLAAHRAAVRIREEAEKFEWRTPCTRPRNRPARRVEDLVRLISASRNSLSGTSWTICKSRNPFRAIAKEWNVSPSLGRRLMVNVMLPWLVVMARRRGEPWWEDVAIKRFCEAPPADSNALTRAVARFFGYEDERTLPLPRTAIYQQGLQWMAEYPERWMVSARR